MSSVFTIPEDYNLTFSPVSGSWYGGLFSGNGELGVMVYADRERELLSLQLGHTLYIDRRPEEMRTGRVSYDSPRLEIGCLYLKAPGIGENSTLTLDLMRAEIKGSVSGKPFRLFTVKEPSVIVVETPLEFAFFEVAQAISPRYFVCNDMPQDLPGNPEPLLRENSCTQELLNGKSFTSAWKKEDQTLFITCAFGEGAQSTLQKCSVSRVKQWKKDVEYSYRKFYGKSSLSIPDSELERFYAINLYKWHSAARKENNVALDLMGPWSKKTAWCALWWNLNIQLTYQWLQTANRSEEMRPLIRMLSDNLEQLRKNTKTGGGMAIGRASSYDCRSPVKSEKGNLPWVCHILAETFFHTGDRELLCLVKKLLSGVLKEYESLLYTTVDKVIHMKETFPPEYGPTRDATFDLALLRKCILHYLTLFPEDSTNAPQRERYRLILENLTEYAADEETGYRLGTDLAFTRSHPHPNHLFMVYPLELPHDKEKALKSLEQFLSMKEEHHGFSYTNAAGMFVRYGNGNRAAELLHTLLDWMRERSMENTMYHENGSPVIETPFGFNSVLQDMLLLSSREKIRLFPAIPDSWEKASFCRFHCMNDITVSASFRRTDHEILLECTLVSPANRQTILELPDKTKISVALESGQEKILKFKIQNKTHDPVMVK